jgi:hypothetical protein
MKKLGIAKDGSAAPPRFTHPRPTSSRQAIHERAVSIDHASAPVFER